MLNKNIHKIDSLLFNKSKRMENPVIEHDVGALIYFSTKYKYSNEEKYKVKSLTLFKKFIDVFPEYEFQTGILEGFDGVGILLTHLKDCKILDTDYLLDDIEPYLIQSIKLTISNNNFDLLYGGIGKIQYLLSNNRFKEDNIKGLIDDLIDNLYETRIEINGRIYWHELDSDKINLGLSHGITSVFIFLIRLKELKIKNKYINRLIKGLINSFIYFENFSNGISIFGAGFPYSKKNPAHSRLAWCYGDLGIAYAFLYGSKVLNDKRLKIKYYEMLDLLLQRGVSDSGLVHFNDYSFFDTGFCHGISGIFYIFYKLNELEPNLLLEKKLKYWENELLKNIDIQLNIKEKIYFPNENNVNEEIYFIETETMLNGISGVGLVLLTMQYRKADWSNFFLLY